ncbi:hypothetical protein GGG16DRAFT_20687, partial [Schizophyllum commune]
LLTEAGLPLSFWLDAYLTAQYLRNRMPTTALPPNVTPYEMRNKQKPDISHLRVFGCRAF